MATLRGAVELVAALAEGRAPAPLAVDLSRLLSPQGDYAVDFREVRGQQSVKRALEVASVGAHNILLFGAQNLL